MLESLAWWAWPLIMLAFTFLIGLISPMSGVGGGVLFVPLTTAFFPFSVDFVRGAGLMVALSSALASSPQLIRSGLASLKITAPTVTVSMVTSVLGGAAGLWITKQFADGQYYVTIALGVILLFVLVVMALSKRVEYPDVQVQGPFAAGLGLEGCWYEPTQGKLVHYKCTHLRWGVPAFALTGFIAGMFGMGSGWANVPILNLIMGAPIKVATSTSMLIIAVNTPAAAWVYLANGAILPMIVVPAVVGISLGARIGAKLALRAKPKMVRHMVMGILLVSGVLNIVKGLGGLGVIPKGL